MEHHSDSTLIHFLRSAVLLAALVAVPGAAVCWNMLPKSHFSNEEGAETLADAPEPCLLEPCSAEPDSDPATMATETLPTLAVEDSGAIKRMGGNVPDSRDVRIPSAFEHQSVVLAAQNAEVAPKTAQTYVPNAVTSHDARNFPSLENRLKLLGAKYYRLEKWGSSGDLFRFSCYVSAVGPHRYQKHFQAIDTDELRVMESVIREIEQWKNE